MHVFLIIYRTTRVLQAAPIARRQQDNWDSFVYKQHEAYTNSTPVMQAPWKRNNAFRLTANVQNIEWNKVYHYKAGDVVYLVDGPTPGPNGIPIARVAYWEEHHNDRYDPPEVFELLAHLLERELDVPDREVCHPSCCEQEQKNTQREGGGK